MADLVLDASVIIDVLTGALMSDTLDQATVGERLLAPAHLDAEVMSGLGRLSRAGALSDVAVGDGLERLGALPVERVALAPLLLGAWGRRATLRLADALYVELASIRGGLLLTRDARLARAAPLARYVDASASEDDGPS